MSVNEKMTAIADAIRECTGATEKLGLDAMAESIPNVYKAGQNSMVDESKIIPKTVSGTYISVDDVSEIPHSVGCKIERINLLQNKKGDYSAGGITWTVNDDGTLNISGTIGTDQAGAFDYYYFGGKEDNDDAFTLSYDAVMSTNKTFLDSNNVVMARTSIGTIHITGQSQNKSVVIPSGTKIYGICIRVYDMTIDESNVYVMLNKGDTALPYTPYASLISKNKWKWFDSLSYEGNGVNHSFIDEYNVGWSGKFVFSCDVELSDITYSATGNLIYLSIVLEDGTTNYHGIVTDKTTNGKSVFVVDATTSPIYRLGVVVHNRWTGGTINITNIMLNEGGIALPYTPCTPNLARATKSYTHTNNGVTFDAKVNESEFTLNGKITTLSSFTLPIGNVPAGTYTFSFANLQGSDYIFLQGSDNTVLVSMTSGVGKGTFTTTKEESLKMCVCLNPSTDVTYDNTHIYFQLEEGSTATKYIPYKNDYSTVSVTKCGKNLFNTEKFVELVKTYDSTATEEVVDGRRCIRFISQKLYHKNFSEVFKFDPNKIYTWSMYCKFVELLQGELGNLAYGFLYGDEKPETTNVLSRIDGLDVKNRYISIGKGTFSEFKQTTITSSNILPLSGIAFSYGTNAYWLIDLDSIQIEEGSDVTDVVPYTAAQILTPSADGTVEGMTSISPYMNIFCDNKDVNIELSYNKSWGMQTKNDRFWDTIQNFGSRQSYASSFEEWKFTENFFKPKHDIRPTNADKMFRNTYDGVNSIDLTQIGVEIDFSNTIRMQNAFDKSAVRKIGVLDCSNVTATNGIYQLFYSHSGANSIEWIDKFIVSENTCAFNLTFQLVKTLKHCVFEGVISKNGLVLSTCTELDHESLMSIINCLKDYSQDTSGTSWKVTLGGVLLSKLTNDEKMLAINKGWELV
jgi:hypothetical protein